MSTMYVDKKVIANDGTVLTHNVPAERLAESDAAIKELVEALKEIMHETGGQQHSIIAKDRAFAIARAILAKHKATP